MSLTDRGILRVMPREEEDSLRWVDLGLRMFLASRFGEALELPPWLSLIHQEEKALPNWACMDIPIWQFDALSSHRLLKEAEAFNVCAVYAVSATQDPDIDVGQSVEARRSGGIWQVASVLEFVGEGAVRVQWNAPKEVALLLRRDVRARHGQPEQLQLPGLDVDKKRRVFLFGDCKPRLFFELHIKEQAAQMHTSRKQAAAIAGISQAQTIAGFYKADDFREERPDGLGFSCFALTQQEEPTKEIIVNKFVTQKTMFVDTFNKMFDVDLRLLDSKTTTALFVFAGERVARETALEFTKTLMVPCLRGWHGVEIPHGLKEWCSKMVLAKEWGVPAIPELSTTAGKMGAFFFSSVTGTPSSSSSSSSSSAPQEGTLMEARYGSSWHDVTFLEFSGDMAKIRWCYNDSEDEVPATDLREKLDEILAQCRDRRARLHVQGNLQFLLAGKESVRRRLSLIVMQRCGTPAVFQLGETALDYDMSPVPEADTAGSGFATEAVAIAQEFATASRWAFLGKVANCIAEQVGNFMYIAGSQDERSRGCEFARWVMSAKTRKLRPDICMYTVPDECRGRLAESKLAEIEQNTRTLCILEEDWSEVAICSHDAAAREAATSALEVALEQLKQAQFEGASDQQWGSSEGNNWNGSSWQSDGWGNDTGWSGSGSQDWNSNQQSWNSEDWWSDSKPTQDENQNQQSSDQDNQASALSALEAARQKVSNPEEVIQQLTQENRLPATIDEWNAMQHIIWKGHQVPPSGWTRVWSRSKKKAYFARISDGTTTMDFPR